MKRRDQYLILFCMLVICSIWILYRDTKWVHKLQKHYSHGTCVPRDHIFFLKTHKCGGSTVQNILMRRGLERGLNFVLPKFANYLGYPEHFNPAHHIDPELTLPEGSQKFDIFAHHTRDTKRITIMRDPAKLFESLYNYYDLSNKQFNGLQFQDVILKDMNELMKLFPSNMTRYVDKIGINQMAFDMGMETSSFNNPNETDELIEFIDKEFHLVMISEYMEASLVLLADLMCWSLEEVAFLTVNVRPLYNRVALNRKSIDKLHLLNNVDIKLYNYFLHKLRLQIKDYGIQKMHNDVSKLIYLNNQLYEDCVINRFVGTRKLGGSSFPVINFNLRANAPKYCKYVVLNELQFTDLLRNHQILKYSSLKRLQIFNKLN